MLADFQDKLSLGLATTRRNPSLTPILAKDGPLLALEPKSLEDALAERTMEVTELSAQGHVPELRVKNSGNTPVLILDGEELVGAKQNRIVNVTILLPPLSEIVSPVSCVEAGRWSYSRPSFAAAGDTRYLKTSKIVLRNASGAPAHVLGVSIDITERKQAEEQAKLLMHEVSHRAKNLLTVVQVVARQTAGEVDPALFVDRFGQRLAGFAGSVDLLVRNQCKGADIADLARSQLAHLGDLIGTRVTFEAPPLRFHTSAAQSIGMALHELATNAGSRGRYSSAAAAAARLRSGLRVPSTTAHRPNHPVGTGSGTPS